jgi:hypothetical protein
VSGGQPIQYKVPRREWASSKLFYSMLPDSHIGRSRNIGARLLWLDVRFWREGYVREPPVDARFLGKRRHQNYTASLPLLTRNGH